MKQKPKSYADSFWGDLANAITLRPVYRPPVEAPMATATVTLQSSAEPASASEQQKAEEERFRAVVREELELLVVPAKEAQVPAGTVQQRAEEKAAVAVEHEAQEELHSSRTTAPVYRYLKEEQDKSFGISQGQEANTGSPAGQPSIEVTTTPSAPKQRSNPYFITRKSILDSWTPTNIITKSYNAGESATPQAGKDHVVVNGEWFPVQSFEVGAKPSSARVGAARPVFQQSDTPITPPDISSGRVRRILKPKLTASQLKGLGFSEYEAVVLEGLYRGRRLGSIATRLSVKPSHVLHIIKQLMGKMEVRNMNSLLKKVRTLHQESKKLSVMEAVGLRAAISDEPPSSEPRIVSGIVAVHPASFIERPKGINIPVNHPDHPANDEGAKQGKGQESKRPPAHSTESTPSRKPE
ncbi:hypothetical protein [Arthrobacter sp. SLBN-122]|uniref:hypothetical protein n=1 Tax=Arthrobacter sp. SLBN-122 TaxID=2768455 RepID=UPI0011510041|nr:hypothetical protein [Arthrobacter sp. SLBN-122]TQJ35774.1 hypothetical protein FBY36_3053 [Arthrobacter sp. SLBN-122]